MNLDLLQDNLLFKNIEKKDIQTLLNCLKFKIVSYKKNETIFNCGDKISQIGIILEGEAHLTKIDYWGNSTIVTNLQKNEIFGEAFAFCPNLDLSVNVIASKDSKILFLNIENILNSCNHCHSFHTTLLKNIIFLFAQKNILLNNKLTLITQKTIKEKVLFYLSNEALKHNSNTFTISYTRQQLADYLGVDRSALSAELSKMQKANLIEYDKNYFKLIGDNYERNNFK